MSALNMLNSAMIFALATTPVVAMAASTTAVMTVKATVNAGLPCVINDGRDISVNFETIISNKVDGKNYTRPIPYSFSCTGQTKNAMKMRFTGAAAGSGFTANTVLTDIKDLGVRLQMNDAAYPLNTWVSFTYPDIPKLTATPVKREGVSLVGGQTGNFTATATLQVTYQ